MSRADILGSMHHARHIASSEELLDGYDFGANRLASRFKEMAAIPCLGTFSALWGC